MQSELDFPSASVAVLIVLCSAFGGPARAMADADISRGAVLFTNNCASCHAGGMNVVKEKRTLKSDALERFVGLDEVSVQRFFKSSMQHRMLVFPNVENGKLEEDDISDLSAFIVDQAVNAKW